MEEEKLNEQLEDEKLDSVDEEIKDEEIKEDIVDNAEDTVEAEEFSDGLTADDTEDNSADDIEEDTSNEETAEDEDAVEDTVEDTEEEQETENADNGEAEDGGGKAEKDETEDGDDDLLGGDDIDDEDDDLLEDADDLDEDDDDDEEDGGRKKPKGKSKKSVKDKIEENKRRKKEKQLLKDKKKRKGYKIVPYEIVEDENPTIKLYNEIARHAYNYDKGAISREGISKEKLNEIYNCVLGDFPEIFWVKTYSSTPTEMFLEFRCTKANGELDVKQVERKLSELKAGARYFTRGISRRTDPYKALLTIYKRLILTLDYDSKGLDARIDLDMSKDDRLRSLHSALVRHKTVCAGYASAVQYLLHSVGISCAWVLSEVRNGGCHAFNIVKIGKYCYYLDATWGDWSNTKNGSAYSDFITYDYCCVPYSEFIQTDKSMLHNHIPSHVVYPWFKKELKANRHEYYRYRNCFISRYNEDDLVRVFVNNAKEYDPVEDGRFSVSFRCTSAELANQIIDMLRTPSNYVRIINKAKLSLEKNKRASKLLDKRIEGFYGKDNPVVKIFYVKDEQKKKK